ncbi:restriction endonuclease subunit S [Streptomyces cyaneofuscatus]|uniref:restriction endonuclease subunit S n=1 Tax=Streptomyces cyaneofuscatus TaxID=66883 RepID=UPI002954B410|nr:restriction endonuclease subunit S [Streptomyces cyaneofuscatus]WOP10908.1 restriction endonuclease subunit S [Streptomyces cyaneofuscatus]
MAERMVSLAELVDEKQIEVGAGRPRSVDQELPILRVADVLDGKIGSPDFSPPLEGYSRDHGPKVSRPGDIVLTVKGTVGRVALIPREGPLYAYSPQLCYFRPRVDGPLVARYLYYWFRGADFWIQANALKGQTDMADFISLGDILSLKLRVPSRTQQEVVADVLGALDDKIAVNGRIASTYEQLLQGKFAKLGLADEPCEGTSILVTDLVAFNPKTDKPAAVEPVYVDMAALQVDRAGIPSWSRREPKSGSRFTNGDTLLARITPCLENGKTGHVDFMADGEIGIGSTEFIVIRSLPGVPSQLSYFLARDQRFREHAIRNMVGSSGRQRVSAAAVATYFVNEPDADALASFGADAAAAFAHMKSLESESRTLAALRDTLLPQLMSGKLRVRDAERIVEDAV